MIQIRRFLLPLRQGHRPGNRSRESGADFFLTQPVFDLEKARQFIRAYEEKQGPLEIPILVGVLPLVTDRHARFLHNEVPGISIPESIQHRMVQSGENSTQEGVRIARELVQDLQRDFQGVYFIPAFNRFDMVAEIIEETKKS